MRTIADPAVLTDLTTRLGRLTVERRPLWGAMTAHQMAAHLANSSEACLGRCEFGAPRRSANVFLKVFALYFPLRWPHGIKTGADPAGRVLAEPVFEADRSLAITSLGDLAGAPLEAFVVPHPIFGPMTPDQWRRWAFLHVDHHLRQFGL